MKRRTVRNFEKKLKKGLKALIKKIEKRISLLEGEKQKISKELNRTNPVRYFKKRQFRKKDEELSERIEYWRQVEENAINLKRNINLLSSEEFQEFLSETSAIIEKEEKLE